MADERVGLELDVDGADEYTRAADKVAMLEKQLRDLQARRAAGNVTDAEFSRLQTRIVTDLNAQQAVLVRHATATHGVNTASVAATGGTRNFGMAVLEGSRALEDLQFGMVGVLNNVPLLLMSLGVGSGATGVVSVLAVGIHQLVRNWDDLKSAFGQGGTFDPAIDSATRLKRELEEVGKTIERLESKGGLDFWEKEELTTARTTRDRLKAGAETQAKAESLVGGMSVDQQERAAGIKQAVADVTPQVFKDSLLTALERSADEFGTVRDPATGRRKTPEAMAARLESQALGGDKFAIDQIGRILEEEFGPNSPVAAAIRENTPEMVAEWEKVTEAAVESGKAAAAAMGSHRDMLASVKQENEKARPGVLAAENDALNRAGAEFEPTSDEMRDARRQAGANDVRRNWRRAMQAQQRMMLANTGGGRMGVMQRQMLQRQFGAGNRFAGSRMAAMQRQMATRAGGGAAAVRARERATQDYRDAVTRFQDSVNKLASEGVQVRI